MLIRTPIASAWRLRALGGPVPPTIAGRTFDAEVPGDVHSALRRADAIPNPVDDDHEHRLGWIGESDWAFETALPRLTGPAADAERIELVFHGVDTVARVELDGVERGRSRNMHRTWRVPARELADRDVALRVAIASPIAAATAELERLGARWTVFNPLTPFIRKNACAFGWDWGPSLPGAGIWRPVEIEAWSTARIAAVRPTVRVAGDDGVVLIDVELERTATGRELDLELVVEVGAHRTVIPAPAGSDRVRGRLDVPAPAKWWPAGLGEAALHDLRVTLRHGGADLDARELRIGFRELVVEQIDDEDGGRSFGITVNGVRMFVRGFNWIPDDTSVAAVTEADVRRRVAETLALGANLLRVWGGGVFESDAFYRACDEAGVLVWQDFLFACAAYPEEAPFTEEVEAEARDNVTRLMPHPSLAIWNGNNENLWFWTLHDWEHVLDGATWGEGFYFDLLPRVVAELDPDRTYVVGSPSSGGRWDDPNDPTRGIVHWWIPDDYRAYDDVRPRFVSEFGFQGPPARSTFDDAVHDDPALAPFSPGVVQRQKAAGGTERINDVLDIHFGVPRDFDEWYWLAQLNQARAVRYGVERFRTLEPYCRGTVVWQLNDCWPSLSWSMIDVADRWKPVAYAVREAYQDRIVVLRMEDGAPTLFACNSTDRPWAVEVDAQRWRHGARVGARTLAATVPAHEAIVVPLDGLGDALAPDELLVATAGERRSVLIGATDREFDDAEPEFDVEVSAADGGVAVTIAAATLLRDTTLLVDLIDADAHADRNLVTLLPGERATWTIGTAHQEAFTAERVRGVLRTAHAATDPDRHYRGLAALEAERRA